MSARTVMASTATQAGPQPGFDPDHSGLMVRSERWCCMDLSTTYLGFELPHPLMPGASPLVDDLDTVRRLEDAGAAAIVMHSLFEEQILLEERTVRQCLGIHEHGFAEA